MIDIIGFQTLNAPRQPLSETVEAAVKKLVSVEHYRAASLVSMPIMYPSGASVVLEISAQAGRVFISDRAGGFQEAEFLGATRLYGREAIRVASDAGIRFDGRDMFVAEVPIGSVTGAMALVASCSANAANICALKSAERDEKYAKDALFEKLTEVYGTGGFEKEVQVIGSSNHKWKVDAVVKQNHSMAIFNSVTKSYVSAAGTAAKFHDFARLEIAPRRVAVITSREEVGDWIGVLASAANAVIEINAANDQFVKAGKAA
jgi:hypothetical protein